MPKIARLVDSKVPAQAGVDEPLFGFMPMPIVMVSCISPEGRPNIIPIIAWSFACRWPPKVTIGLCEGDYTPGYFVRASYRMIRDTGEFVINFPEASRWSFARQRLKSARSASSALSPKTCPWEAITCLWARWWHITRVARWSSIRAGMR